MKPKFDFSKARRGALVPKDPSKTLISIRLDNRALDYIAAMVDRSGGGSLENVINTVLSDLIAVCERVPLAEREYFFARAARADLPRALEILSRAGVGSPPDDKIIRTRPKKSRAKRAVGISAK
jgi:hypothetical protein